MYKIIDGRGTGKTSRLLLLAKESGATVVCSNPDAMRQKAYAYGLTGIDFISYEDYLNPENHTQIAHYLIDEIDGLLDRMTNCCVDGYTISMEN